MRVVHGRTAHCSVLEPEAARTWHGPEHIRRQDRAAPAKWLGEVEGEVDLPRLMQDIPGGGRPA
ncbi:hypothetical protein ACU4GD_38115 [Cupriavidus basilensis]